MSDKKISDLTDQLTIHDGDYGVGVDTTDLNQAVTGSTKKWTWTTMKAFLKTYFDSLYASLSANFPGSSVADDFATFSGATGKIIKDSGLSLDTDTSLTANSNTKIPSQQATKSYVDNNGGADWKAIAATLTYSSADAPTYVCTTSVDLTASIGVGRRIKLTHAAAIKYFIVTAIDASTITLYGGTDYTLAATAITLPYQSGIKAPLGFPLDPLKWTQTTTSSADVNQASAVSGTWYNLGSLSLSVPIGSWYLSWKAVYETESAVTTSSLNATLSTANNSESDTEFTAFTDATVSSGRVGGCLQITKNVLLAAKTPYYLLCKFTGANPTIGFRGDVSKTVIKSICAYL